MRNVCLQMMIPLTLTGLLIGCSSEKDHPDVPVNGTNTPLTFLPDLKGLSRATETDFENGDAISLFAVKKNGDGSAIVLQNEGNHFHNVKYIYNGTEFATDPVLYKASEDELAYFAVYPYSESAGANFSFRVNPDQREYAAYTGSDLCTSTTGYLADAKPNLTFYHRMSNLVVTLEGSNLGGDLSIEYLNAKSAVDVDLNSLTVEPNGEISNIIPNEYGTNTWRAIVAPQEYPAGQPIIKAILNGKEYELAHTGNISLGSGKQVNLTLRIVNEVPVIVSGDIYPWNTGAEINYVIPEEILDKLDDHIDIHYGINPPNVEGCYLIDPFECVYCEDYGNGGFEPGHIVNSNYILFRDQNMSLRTINMSEVSVSQTSYSIGNGAFISGEGNDFTVFFSTEGESRNIYTKEALVISGTKTEEGIKDLQYAFVMIDKGDDPEQLLMEKGVYRVFKDSDHLAVKAEWPTDFSFGRPSIMKNNFNFEYIRRKK